MGEESVSAELQSVSAWLQSIEDELKRKESYGSFSSALVGHSIFRVPKQLKEVNPLAYEPLVVAIGPYKKSRKLQPSVTESFIRISAAKILLPLQHLGPDDFQTFVHRIVGDQFAMEKLAMQYERLPVYNEDALRALFTLDASFVTCFLVYLGYGDVRRPGYFPSTASGLARELGRRVLSDFKIPKRLVTSILRDLFLFENQIPLSLVKGVMSSIMGAGVEKDRSMLKAEKGDGNEDKEEGEEEFLGMCIEGVMRCVNPFQLDLMEEERSMPHCIIHRHTHLLDCLYSAVTMDGGDDRVVRSRVQSTVGMRGIEMQGGVHAREVEARMGVPTAVESAIHLRRAGISFKASRPTNGCASSNVLAIWFDKASATLYLPHVNISQESEAILRNLAVYEMVALQRTEVGSYLALMDDLIDTAQDVQVLRLSGVLEHSLRNDEEVAELWNGMCKNLQMLYETTTLAEAYAAIKEHLCRRMRYKKLWELYAEFSNRYLSAPWLTASVLAATTLLVLTITQTFYSAAIYYKS
ncbi:hypothetical protein GOP47_0026628 [Adiantum capillus-veneris]|nr:hypothetical protein GOP47_0026628 [Adiantum capillus-veneris]